MASTLSASLIEQSKIKGYADPYAESVQAEKDKKYKNANQLVIKISNVGSSAANKTISLMKSDCLSYSQFSGILYDNDTTSNAEVTITVGQKNLTLPQFRAWCMSTKPIITAIGLQSSVAAKAGEVYDAPIFAGMGDINGQSFESLSQAVQQAVSNDVNQNGFVVADIPAFGLNGQSDLVFTSVKGTVTTLTLYAGGFQEGNVTLR